MSVLTRRLRLSINPCVINKNEANDASLFRDGWVNQALTPAELAGRINEGVAPQPNPLRRLPTTNSPSLRSGERPSGDHRFFPIKIHSHPETSNHQRYGQRVRKRLSDTLRPLQAKRSKIVRITASETSDQRNHQSWSGPAVR